MIEVLRDIVTVMAGLAVIPLLALVSFVATAYLILLIRMAFGD